MIEHFKEGLRRWSDFEGRSTRPAFWWFQLSFFLILLAISFVGEALPAAIGGVFSIVGVLFVLLMIVPSLSMAVRRLHDTGKSGWYYLLTVIPLVGFVIMIVLMIQETQPYANKWGPVPGDDEDDGLVNSLVGDNE